MAKEKTQEEIEEEKRKREEFERQFEESKNSFFVVENYDSGANAQDWQISVSNGKSRSPQERNTGVSLAKISRRRMNRDDSEWALKLEYNLYRMQMSHEERDREIVGFRTWKRNRNQSPYNQKFDLETLSGYKGDKEFLLKYIRDSRERMYHKIVKKRGNNKSDMDDFDSLSAGLRSLDGTGRLGNIIERYNAYNSTGKADDLIKSDELEGIIGSYEVREEYEESMRDFINSADFVALDKIEYETTQPGTNPYLPVKTVRIGKLKDEPNKGLAGDSQIVIEISSEQGIFEKRTVNVSNPDGSRIIRALLDYLKLSAAIRMGEESQKSEYSLSQLEREVADINPNILAQNDPSHESPVMTGKGEAIGKVPKINTKSTDSNSPQKENLNDLPTVSQVMHADNEDLPSESEVINENNDNQGQLNVGNNSENNFGFPTKLEIEGGDDANKGADLQNVFKKNIMSIDKESWYELTGNCTLGQWFDLSENNNHQIVGISYAMNTAGNDEIKTFAESIGIIIDSLTPGEIQGKIAEKLIDKFNSLTKEQQENVSDVRLKSIFEHVEKIEQLYDCTNGNDVYDFLYAVLKDQQEKDKYYGRGNVFGDM